MMEDIVTVHSNINNFFQIFLTNGKILQLKADSVEKQAQWMAMIKVGLGKGKKVWHYMGVYNKMC